MFDDNGYVLDEFDKKVLLVCGTGAVEEANDALFDCNKIEYITEKVFKKRDLGIDESSFYQVDFFFEKYKLILEIDGSQHWKYKEQIEYDNDRDLSFTNNGYIVYRIKWNKISTPEGSTIMKEKIKNFIDFYNKIKNK